MNWDYVAGFFDGEGSVTIGHGKDGRKADIQFANTNKAVLEQIRDFLGGGNIYMLETPHGYPYYQLRFSNHVVYSRIAKELIPRCIIKRDKLVALVKFAESMKWKKIFRPYTQAPARQLTPELLREQYLHGKLSVNEIARLNNCTGNTVHKRLVKFEIPRRSLSEALKLSCAKRTYE